MSGKRKISNTNKLTVIEKRKEISLKLNPLPVNEDFVHTPYHQSSQNLLLHVSQQSLMRKKKFQRHAIRNEYKNQSSGHDLAALIRGMESKNQIKCELKSHKFFPS